jgi:hypothetical protein
MSWLSVLKNNIIATVTHAAPPAEKTQVHAAATDVASAIGSLLTALESVALDVIDTAIAAKFGPAAAVVEHDFLNAIISVASAKKAAAVQTAPAPVTANPTKPV